MNKTTINIKESEPKIATDKLAVSDFCLAKLKSVAGTQNESPIRVRINIGVTCFIFNCA
jgi:hypothetical protein